MDEHKEEGGPVVNQTEPLEEAAEEHGVPVKTETLGGKVDVPSEEPGNGDVEMVEGLDSGVCNSSEVASGTVENPNGGENHGADGSSEQVEDTSLSRLEAKDGCKDNSVCEEKSEDADVGRAEELDDSVDGGVVGDTAMHEVEIKNGEVLHDVEGVERKVSAVEGKRMDAAVKAEMESKNLEPCGAVERADKMVTSVEVKMTDNMAQLDSENRTDEIHENAGVEKTKLDSESKNGETHENKEMEKTVSSVGTEANDQKSNEDVEVKKTNACGAGADIQTEESQLSAVGGEAPVKEEKHADTEKNGSKNQVLDEEKSSDITQLKGGEEKEATNKTEEDNRQMDVECESIIQEVEEKEVDVLRDERRNLESDATDAKQPGPVEALEVNTQFTKEETAALAHGLDPGTPAEQPSEEQANVIDEGEGESEAMEINSVNENLSQPQEEHVLNVDTVSGRIENTGDVLADANTVQSQEASRAEADRDDSNVEKKMEIEKTDVEGQTDNGAATGESTDKIMSTVSAKPNEIVSTGSEERRDDEKQKDNDATTREFTGKTASTVSTDRRGFEEQNGNDAKTGEFTQKIVPTVSAEPDGPTEEAVTGEVAPLDHNVLFDPNSDIAKFIDFSGVLPWSGNNKEIKAETTSVPVEEGTRVIEKTEEVIEVEGQEGVQPDVQVQGPVENVQESLLEEHKSEGVGANTMACEPYTVDDMEIDKTVADSENLNASSEDSKKNSNETLVVAGEKSSAPIADGRQELSGANLDFEKQGEGEVQESFKKKPEEQESIRAAQGGDLCESLDNQGQDTKMEEKLEDAGYFDEGTGSDAKTNDLKRKADALGEDSSQARKTISVAKVSTTLPHLQKPSFKIGECIARAASQMAGSPSVFRGSNFSDENLSVDNFLSQLHCAATEPAKGNNVSDIAAGFLLDYRNSLISQQVALDKVSGKRGRPSYSNAGGAEAFEFDEMSDTYWTDRVIHNGGEEQPPSTEKANYQIVPVELKPAQIQRSRRPYTKRRHSENNNISHFASEKPVSIDENSPAELVMNFSETDIIPSEMNLNKMFRHFGPIRDSQTEVDRESSRARVVFKKCADAEVAYNSAGRFSIFGTKVVNYELSYTITEPFKVQPYVVTLGEEDAAHCLPSQV